MEKTAVIWKFHRIGGLDQVSLRQADELRNLRRLDPKLWAALSCPASGLECDQHTLTLIDADHDGRIRMPEILAAVEWLCARLDDPQIMVEPSRALPLDAIREDTQEGRRARVTARAVLHSAGKAADTSISREDVEQAAREAANRPLNGDGVLPALDVFDPDVRVFIKDALAVMGGVMDAGGQPGIDAALAEAFVQSLKALRDWQKAVDSAVSPLGGDTAEAWALLRELEKKLDDYFLRCELAAFAPGSVEALNAHEAPAAPGAPAMDDAAHSGLCGLLDGELLAALPLSRVEANKPLDLDNGLNPAWRDKLERFFALAAPLCPQGRSLDKKAWQALKEAFAPYAQALADKPAPQQVAVAVAPSAGFESLPEERVDEILESGVLEKFLKLAGDDLAAPATAGDIAELERLVLYYLHLHRLLMNFVSLYDFYSMRRTAVFQSGVLYLDGRGCRLCLPVNDAERHAALASYSQLCLVYCDCRRKNADEEAADARIVAAVTAGDADLLIPGRNGVYVDNEGRDWDATITRVVSNPISLRESVWQPYKRFGRMLSEQVAKFAGARQAGFEAKVAAKATESSAALTAATASGAAAPPAFDIGRSAGIFAAIGLAIGAIGTALAGLAGALFSLSWWQFPLLLLGLFLLISGPSVVMAWLKLRKRNLGPLLEASGWAVNRRIPINLALGAALTATAQLPPNAERSYRDPLGRRPRWPWLLAALLALAVLAGGWLWFSRDELGDVWRGLVESGQMDKAPEAANPPQGPAHTQP